MLLVVYGIVISVRLTSSWKEYMPMFVNNKGMALTYNDFTNRFKKLVTDYLVPLLKTLADKELLFYGEILEDFSIACHILRHFFTVQLVVHGYDTPQIMAARGDKDPTSAYWYMSNKGDLRAATKDVSTKLTELVIKAGEHFNEQQ